MSGIKTEIFTREDLELAFSAGFDFSEDNFNNPDNTEYVTERVALKQANGDDKSSSDCDLPVVRRSLVGKYCAFGIGYKDSKGIIVDEGEKYCTIKYLQSNNTTAEFRSLLEVFDTEDELNNWISAQGYKYDPR